MTKTIFVITIIIINILIILILLLISMIIRRGADILHSVKAAGFSSDPDRLQVIYNLMPTTLMTMMVMMMVTMIPMEGIWSEGF